MTAYNTCDKCYKKIASEDLVWITADGFTPKEGEEVSEKIHYLYDALCERCYLEEIENIPATQ